MTNRNFAVAGLSLTVVDSEGDGRPVIFQHGLCGDAAQPAEVFPRDSRFRCITLECRGHGGSMLGDVDQVSISTFADDLAAMIQQQQLAPLVVGGISMGAAIALRLAVSHPTMVSGLVLARPAWTTTAAPPNLGSNLLVGTLLENFAAPEAQAIFDRSRIAKRLHEEAPDNLASLRGFFHRQPVDQTAALLTRIAVTHPGVSEGDLANLNLPTLVIGHHRDCIHPWPDAVALARAIAGARLVEITPKASDRNRYLSEFRHELRLFLDDCGPTMGR